MDIKSLQAIQGYGQPGRIPSGETSGASDAFQQAAGQFGQSLAEAEQIALSSMTSNADPHALVEALANTQIAVETAVTVRDRVVEAYQEILRMPV